MADHLRDDPWLHDVPEEGGCKVLGPCVLLSRLGKGGMGAVYAGRHRKLEIDIAVKCLLPATASRNEGAVARFEREAKLAARLNHPNVVRIFDVDCLHGLHFIVMELVKGETARERVARKGGPLPPGEALTIAHEAAKGLAAVHAAGIVHRDVKPDNILISSDGAVKLGDLGLGCWTGAVGGEAALTQTGTAMGTPRYMPPEQWDGLAKVGPPGDVWALGATLYFLLAGEDAYAGDEFSALLRRVCTEPFPDVREMAGGVPDGVAELIARATERNIARRFPHGKALADALEALAESHAPTGDLTDPSAGTSSVRPRSVSPPPSRSRRAAPARTVAARGEGKRRPRPRRPWRGALASLLALSAAGVLAVVFWPSREGEARRIEPVARDRAGRPLPGPGGGPHAAPPAGERADDAEAAEDASAADAPGSDATAHGEPPAPEPSTAALTPPPGPADLTRAEHADPGAAREATGEPEITAEPRAPGDRTLPAESALAPGPVEAAAAAKPAPEPAPPPAPAPQPPSQTPPTPSPQPSPPSEAPVVAATAVPVPRSTDSPRSPDGPRGGEKRPIFGFSWIAANERGFHEYRHDATGIVFVLLPGGEFSMGSSKEERARAAASMDREPDAFAVSLLKSALDSEGPRHAVALDPFLIAKREVSQAEWRKVMGTSPARIQGDGLPVESITWLDAKEFCRRVELMLPSEAQWEYACRGGGPREGDAAAPPAQRGPRPVDATPVNAFGIAGMAGNVAEWCEDAFLEGFYSRPEATERNPLAAPASVSIALRSVRGGSWASPAASHRAAHREGAPPDRAHFMRGFRPAFYPLP